MPHPHTNASGPENAAPSERLKTLLGNIDAQLEHAKQSLLDQGGFASLKYQGWINSCETISEFSKMLSGNELAIYRGRAQEADREMVNLFQGVGLAEAECFSFN